MTTLASTGVLLRRLALNFNTHLLSRTISLILFVTLVSVALASKNCSRPALSLFALLSLYSIKECSNVSLLILTGKGNRINNCWGYFPTLLVVSGGRDRSR